MDYPFCKCLNPKIINNKYTNEPITVGCGKCDACNLAKSNHYSAMCSLEESEHKFCMFVTLTYSNENIPIVYPVLNFDEQSVPYYTISLNEDQYERFDEKYFDNGTLVDKKFNAVRFFNMRKIDMLVKKTNLPFGGIPVLVKKDLQKFIKRLRFYLAKYTQEKFLSSFSDAEFEAFQLEALPETQVEKIKFFACGELGPVHFRPHFHLLIYFDEQSTLDALSEALYSAWTYGYIDFSLSRGQCGSYCASYVNSFASTPPFYKNKPFRPFVVHSTFFGAKALLEDKEEIYKHDVDYLNFKYVQLYGTMQPLPLWRQIISYFFPKCRRFNERDIGTLYPIYTLYKRACDDFGDTNIKNLARLIFCTEDPWYNQYKDDILTKDFNNIRYKTTFDYESFFDFPNSLSVIENDLYLSKHFIDFCCNGKYINFYERIKQIQKVYKTLDQWSLNNWYETRQNCHDPIHPSFWYDNFLPDKPDEICYDWDSNNLYRNYRSYVKSQYQCRIKHKKLNDLNKIFL